MSLKLNGKYVIAVSGGPDSMALLDMHKDKCGVVAHVNYHKRDTALRDERIVRKYCKENKLKFSKLDVYEHEGNFQDYARVRRYEFFAKLVKKHHLDGVLTAHHLDDLLETYLLQEKRGSTPSYYGLREYSLIQGVGIYRPLLKYEKRRLLKYCEDKHIPYGIDESNLSDAYKRNVIRHEVIEKMTPSEKMALKKEIDLKNRNQERKIKKTERFLRHRDRISFEEYMSFEDKETLLRVLLQEDLSFKQIEDLIRQLDTSGKIGCEINGRVLVKEYGYIEVYDRQEDYEFILEKLSYRNFGPFKTSSKGEGINGVTLSEEDFPVTIRNFREGDRISLRYGEKKIARFFIDRKISRKDRESWPIVLNKKGEVVLVPGIGCELNHYSHKHNLFVIK